MTGILVGEFIILVLIFLRVFSALSAAPVFSLQSVPVLARVLLGAFITYLLFLTLDRTNLVFELNIATLAAIAIVEIITGVLIGFAINIVFFGISYAGVIIGFEMGLSMANVFNPLEESTSGVISESLYFIAMLVFFIINGHHYVIRALSSTYDAIPIGRYSATSSAVEMLIKYSASVFIIAVKIAAPFIVSFLLLHIAEGIIARVIPQMQIFFVTFPLKIMIGFLLLMALIPIYIYVIKGLLRNFEDSLFQLIKVMAA